MSSPSKLWEAWTLSQSLRQRPSSLYAIRSSVTAFYFDRVVTGVGRQIESEIEAAQAKTKSDKGRQVKAQLVLNRWLRSEGGAKYRDPFKS